MDELINQLMLSGNEHFFPIITSTIPTTISWNIVRIEFPSKFCLLLVFFD